MKKSSNVNIRTCQISEFCWWLSYKHAVKFSEIFL